MPRIPHKQRYREISKRVLSYYMDARGNYEHLLVGLNNLKYSVPTWRLFRKQMSLQKTCLPEDKSKILR
jgi:hypothetical protein